ncbi:hypothetical protein CDAR_471421 [Caerostris darwini]|uniref:Uncharacterized protein n=1 Tax=Caerostris darwini TaxID=1538125 RepID=A0AAV4RL71_9ARAC|nr:hypothetical protein CDAR_471421 [Caerostris darwini]
MFNYRTGATYQIAHWFSDIGEPDSIPGRERHILMSSKRNRTARESEFEDNPFFDINSFDDGFDQHWVNAIKEKRTAEKGQTELVYRGKRNSSDYVRWYRPLCVCPLSSGHFSVPANTQDSLCATVRTDEKESGTAYWDVAPGRLDPRGVTHQKISCDHRRRWGLARKQMTKPDLSSCANTCWSFYLAWLHDYIPLYC